MPVNIDEQGVYENMMVRLSEYVDEQVPEFQLRQSGVVFRDELVSSKHPELKVDLETVVLKGVSAHHESGQRVDEHWRFRPHLDRRRVLSLRRRFRGAARGGHLAQAGKDGSDVRRVRHEAGVAPTVGFLSCDAM